MKKIDDDCHFAEINLDGDISIWRQQKGLTLHLVTLSIDAIYQLARMMSPSVSGERWQCPKCEAENFGDCWKCGSSRPRNL